MLVLDTDHASEFGHRSAAGLRLLGRLAGYEPSAITITAITVEEQLRGRLAEINRHASGHAQIAAYAQLLHQVEFIAVLRVLPWDERAATIFDRLRAQRLRVGTQDLKIAAITLAYDATLLTRNTRDFAPVPDLKFENWLL